MQRTCCATIGNGNPTLTLRPRAGAPFVVANTLVGGLAAYGLAGLRPDAWAVGRFALVLALQSLVAVQVMVLSVFLTPNQARRARRGRHLAHPPPSPELVAKKSEHLSAPCGMPSHQQAAASGAQACEGEAGASAGAAVSCRKAFDSVSPRAAMPCQACSAPRRAARRTWRTSCRRR
jgi:hypothetical protein